MINNKKRKTKEDKKKEVIINLIDNYNNVYECVKIIYFDILKELDNDYRSTKITYNNKNGKQITRYKNNLLYISTRKKLTEEEQKDMFNTIINYRYTTTIYIVLSNLLGTGASSLQEIYITLIEKVKKLLSIIEEERVDIEKI